MINKNKLEIERMKKMKKKNEKMNEKRMKRHKITNIKISGETQIKQGVKKMTGNRIKLKKERKK